jgi:hypothetical protein
MATKHSQWEPSYFRDVMLARIGEGFRRYYAGSSDAMPDNIAALLKRLDEKSRDEDGQKETTGGQL